MLLHDVSDVLMESAKAAKYAGYETISLVAFVSFMISWAVLRLWTLPHVIVKMTWCVDGVWYRGV